VSASRRVLMVLLLGAPALGGCMCEHRPATTVAAGAAIASAPPAPVPPPEVVPAGQSFVIAAAGDIAGRLNRHAETAALLLALHTKRPFAALLALGDLQYPSGEYHDFLAYYDSTWGVPPLKAITRPVPGNHEYDQGRSDAQGYFDYFDGPGVPSGIAGERGKGYYSFDLGDWHLVALNSSDGCLKIPCASGSPMHTWLVADLAATKKKCVLAYWHHPRFQAGAFHKDTARVAPLWDALYDAHADLVLGGHEHDFQQLAPLDKSGAPAPGRGLRSFVVGTGGASAYLAVDPGLHPGALEGAQADRAGILELTLSPGSYAWRFLATNGTADGEVVAQGHDVCR
jgi:hypothetical protein